MSQHTASDPAATPVLGRGLILLMATATGVAVANIYYNQPMLGVIEADLPPSPLAGFIPTATQLGYAAGLFLVVPLGDIVERRRLITIQFALLALALAAAALAPNALALAAASVLIGMGSSVAQQIVPFAAALSAPGRQGRTIGTVMAGLLCGILFSRTLAGFVATHAGWRAMFGLGVPLALAAAAVMRATLPRSVPTVTIGYGAALVSLGRLWRHHPALRRATYTQAALFGAFSAFWTVLAFHLAEPHFGLGADFAGLFGLIGAAGVFAAPLAGTLADRRGPRAVIAAGAATVLVSWLVFVGWNSLAGLVVGVLLLDFGTQSALISHQHLVYALEPAARSRLNTVFMTGMFLGGALGSAGATAAWMQGGWMAVGLFGVALGAMALGVTALARTRRGHPQTKTAAH